MARKDRNGSRKTRDQRSLRRNPVMGYYLVVTDTNATERCYFNGLYNSLSEETKDKLVIKVVKTNTGNLVQKCIELTAYEPQYRIPWIVFDRDEVADFDKIIKDAEKAGIHVAWSNPCFEIWMFSYFGNMPVIKESKTCCSKFSELYEAKTGIEYSKSDPDMYRRLCENGDKNKALQIALQKYNQCQREGKNAPSEMYPATKVHELVGEIRSKEAR